jgi:alkanesulfonate monooxygenase SsuD/methylene tetrahydromethanopterin reductase-like flavin-dependent oxidoreductase (luciferase family)
MQFSLFAHMERTDPAKCPRAFEQMVPGPARRGRFGRLIGEHHGMDFTIAPNPFIQLAHISAFRTSRIRLGTGTVIALLHPISCRGGVMADPPPWPPRSRHGPGAYSSSTNGDTGPRRHGRLEAAQMIPAIRGLWAGNYAHDGEFWTFPATTSAPKPVQQPHPPIWVAARDPNSHDFAVRSGCNVQVTPLAAGDQEVASLMQRFDAACANNPQVPRPKILLLQHAFVADGRQEADQIAGALGDFYGLFGKWFQNKRPVDQGSIEPLTEAERQAMPQYAAEAIRKALVIGEPDEVITRLKGYEALGYDQYAI